MKYPHLFTPLRLPEPYLETDCCRRRKVTIISGLIYFPMMIWQLILKLKPGRFCLRLYRRLYCGLENGRHYDWLLPMDNPKMLPGLSKVANAISRHGAVASLNCRMPACTRKLLMAGAELTVPWPRLTGTVKLKCRKK